jgi:hypothetical protein
MSSDHIAPTPFPSALDVIVLAETYGERAVEEIKDPTFEVDVLMHSVKRSIHWAWVFTHLDNSYLREWKIDEATRNQGIE